ncbi:unnamed protein product [Caenorhabditis bovis]|uniref:Uncharacterized protein n=1 Tax=Caenorhabditis bovis TaxID=2654633 RepID=A0A8S1FF40_9PELO|nr:unnamed protein product [Caenorhabditis bovis]
MKILKVEDEARIEHNMKIGNDLYLQYQAISIVKLIEELEVFKERCVELDKHDHDTPINILHCISRKLRLMV